jgi:hypothetical protein
MRILRIQIRIPNTAENSSKNQLGVKYMDPGISSGSTYMFQVYPSSMAETIPRIATRNVLAEDIYNPGLAPPSLLVQSTEFHFPKG